MKSQVHPHQILSKYRYKISALIRKPSQVIHSGIKIIQNNRLFRSSTLRKQRKKRLTQEASNNGLNQGEKSTSGPTIRPVLIQDGLIDIFGKGSSTVVGAKIPGKATNGKSAINLLEQAKIDDVVQKGHMDSLFVSEIGYGMIGGPISMGRLVSKTVSLWG